ncbi:MAG: AAA ATPase, partial [Paramarteilia canceri]
MELPCREEELKIIKNQIENFEKNKSSFALYAYGTPGTGKSACISASIENSAIKSFYINCSSICGSLLSHVCTTLKINVKGSDFFEAISRTFTKPNKKQ